MIVDAQRKGRTEVEDRDLETAEQSIQDKQTRDAERDGGNLKLEDVHHLQRDPPGKTYPNPS